MNALSALVAAPPARVRPPAATRSPASPPSLPWPACPPSAISAKSASHLSQPSHPSHDNAINDSGQVIGSVQQTIGPPEPDADNFAPQANVIYSWSSATNNPTIVPFVNYFIADWGYFGNGDAVPEGLGDDGTIWSFQFSSTGPWLYDGFRGPQELGQVYGTSDYPQGSQVSAVAVNSRNDSVTFEISPPLPSSYANYAQQCYLNYLGAESIPLNSLTNSPFPAYLSERDGAGALRVASGNQWYDDLGWPHVVTNAYQFSGINAAMATVNGTNAPAFQLVGVRKTTAYSQYGEGNPGTIWTMNASNQVLGPAMDLSALVPPGSGWDGVSPSGINDAGAIVGTAYYSGTNTTIGAGTHAVLLLPVQIKPYRPQMVPNSVDLTPTNTSQLIIPPSEVASSGVHIRVNGDNENSNLVEVTFSSPAVAAMSGCAVAVQRSSSNLNVWTTSSKGAAIISTGSNQGNLTLDSNGNATIWVEALAQGGNDLNFLLVSGTTTIGNIGKLHFVNYDSFTQAFSGETFGTPGAAAAQGTFNVCQNLYLEGYNIGYYDVYTISSSTSQPAFGEISNQISSGSITNVGVFGYSHGGGETYNTCNLLAGTAATISFAGYVDAIEYAPPDGTHDFFAQTTYPPGAAYMWNYYQTADSLHSGPVTGASVNLNVNTTAWGAGLYHYTHSGHTGIMASPNVQAALQGAVETYVPKY